MLCANVIGITLLSRYRLTVKNLEGKDNILANRLALIAEKLFAAYTTSLEEVRFKKIKSAPPRGITNLLFQGRRVGQLEKYPQEWSPPNKKKDGCASKVYIKCALQYTPKFPKEDKSSTLFTPG